MGLVVTLKKDQGVNIGDQIKIKVVLIKGGSQVRLHIEAPKGVLILRDSLEKFP